MMFFRRKPKLVPYAIQWVRAGKPMAEFPYWDRVLSVYNERDARDVRARYGLDYAQVVNIGDPWTADRLFKSVRLQFTADVEV